MAKTQTKRAKKTPTFGPKNPEPSPFLGLLFLIFGLLVALAVWDYNPSQNKVFFSDIQDQNLIGNFGVKVAHALLSSLVWPLMPLPFSLSGLLTCFFVRFPGNLACANYPQSFSRFSV